MGAFFQLQVDIDKRRKKTKDSVQILPVSV